MARKCLIEKEKKRAKMVALKREKRAELKAIIMSPYSTHEAKMAAVEKLNKMPKNSARIRQRNRCQLTGRPRGFLRKFQVSRLCFREMANSGLVPGVFKASW